MAHVLMSSCGAYWTLRTDGWKWGPVLPTSWGILGSEGLAQSQPGGGWSVVDVGWSPLGPVVGGAGLLAQTSSRPSFLRPGF